MIYLTLPELLYIAERATGGKAAALLHSLARNHAFGGRERSDPIRFDAEDEAARIFGRVTAAIIAAGHKPRRRIADLMIAVIAIAEELPLFHDQRV